MRTIRIARPSLPVIFLIVLAFIASARPLANFAARVSLKSAFPGSRVSVGAIRLLPLGRVAVSGVSVKNPLYEVTVKEASASYAPLFLLRGIISRVSIDDAVVNVSGPGTGIQELAGSLPAAGKRRGLLRLRELEVRRAQIKLNLKDCSAQALITARVNAQDGLIERVEAAVDSFTYSGAKLERASLTFIQGEDTGSLYCRSISYGKISLKDLESPVSFKGKTISFGKIAGIVSGGKLIGKAEVTLDAPVVYRCSLRVKGLEFSELVKQLKIEEKFTASGPLEGALVLEGKGAALTRIDGDFHSTQPGILRIRDQRIAETIASRIPELAKASATELMVETLNNYKYNKGVIDTGLTDEGLVSSLVFEGEAGGKISFTVVLHPVARK